MLRGTFIERLSAVEQQRRLEEVRRILKADGIAHLHLLTSDRPTGDLLIRLPRRATAVQAVPELSQLLVALYAAGFAVPQVLYHAQSPCFTAGECEFRETRLEASAS